MSATQDEEEAAEAMVSGVHPAREWRDRLAKNGELAPAVEGLLNAYMQLRRRHAEVVHTADALAATLDRLPLGILVLERDRIVVANREALGYLDGQAVRRTVDDRLEAISDEAHQELSVTLLRVLSGEVERAAWAARWGDQDLHFVFTRGNDPRRERVIVCIGNPRALPEPDPESYRALYGLTRTEAEVARQMVLGATPRDIAETLGVGVETTRTHVKHILQKMQCHRQVDVVRVLVTGPASLI